MHWPGLDDATASLKFDRRMVSYHGTDMLLVWGTVPLRRPSPPIGSCIGPPSRPASCSCWLQGPDDRNAFNRNPPPSLEHNPTNQKPARADRSTNHDTKSKDRVVVSPPRLACSGEIQPGSR